MTIPQPSANASAHVESGGTDLALTPHFVDLAVDVIAASKSNPRKHFDADMLADLAASMKTHGLAQPILVRPLALGDSLERHASYELVAGERRLRAARMLEWPTIPCLVRSLDDRQALELQVIENLQREDLHPLEEAEGYELLMKQHGYMVEDLAAKVGKSKAYIYGRLKLTALCAAARKAFYDGQLDASRGLLIARIPHEQLQQEAVEEITQRNMSYRHAVDYVHRKFMLRLAEAPFKTTDALLYPEAGPCTTCPKRTGNQPELFNDVATADVCTDPTCFATKKDRTMAARLAVARADGTRVIEGKAAKAVFPYEHSSQTYGGFELASDKVYVGDKFVTLSSIAKGVKLSPILVVNPHTKHVVEVFDRKAVLTAAQRAGTIPKDKAPGKDQTQQNRDREAKIETAYRMQLLDAVVTAAEGRLTSVDWRLVAGSAIHRLDHDRTKRLFKMLDWSDELLPKFDGPTPALVAHLNALTDGEIALLIFRCALIGEAHKAAYATDTAPNLHAAAERYGVDAKAIKATVRAAMAPKVKAPKNAKVADTANASLKAAVPVRYRNPMTGDTWTGRGRAPKWIEGKDRAPFKVPTETASPC